MLDLFTIFSKGGIVLWCFQSTSQIFTPSVNALIKSVILQERGGTSTFSHEALKLQFKLDNEFELVFVVAYQKILQLSYIDKLLDDIQREFKNKYKDDLQLGKISRNFNFTEDFQRILKTNEDLSHQQEKAPKSSIIPEYSLRDLVHDLNRHWWGINRDFQPNFTSPAFNLDAITAELCPHARQQVEWYVDPWMVHDGEAIVLPLAELMFTAKKHPLWTVNRVSGSHVKLVACISQAARARNLSVDKWEIESFGNLLNDMFSQNKLASDVVDCLSQWSVFQALTKTTWHDAVSKELYVSGCVNAEMFASSGRDLLLDGLRVSGDYVEISLLAFFSPTDYDCQAAASVIASAFRKAKHKPRLILDYPPGDPRIPHAVKDGHGNLTSVVLENGEFVHKTIPSDKVLDFISVEEWESGVCDETMQMKACNAVIRNWQAMLDSIGLGDSVEFNCGCLYQSAGVSSCIYWRDWMFYEPGACRPSSPTDTLRRHVEHFQLDVNQRLTFFSDLAESELHPNFTKAVDYVNSHNSNIALWCFGGLTSFRKCLDSIKNKSRVVSVLLMNLTLETSASLCKSKSGMGMNYNMAVDTKAAAVILELKRLCPNARITIWQTGSSKGVPGMEAPIKSFSEVTCDL